MPTVRKSLRLKEVEGYAQAHPSLPNDKALLVELDQAPIALLYVTPAAHTLAWEGAVDFNCLEREFTEALKALGWANVNVREDPWRKQLSVALVRAGKDDDELVKCRLKEREGYESYTRAMDAPSLLSFVRYDLSDHGGGEPFFSFIAENAALQDDSENEVALKLQRSQAWTKALIGWVIDHHQQRRRLTREIEPESAASVLNQPLAGSM